MREDQNGGVGKVAAQRADEIEGIAVLQIEVQQYEVRPSIGHRGGCGGDGFAFAAARKIGLAVEQANNAFTDKGMVFDDEHPCLGMRLDERQDKDGGAGCPFSHLNQGRGNRR